MNLKLKGASAFVLVAIGGGLAYASTSDLAANADSGSANGIDPIIILVAGISGVVMIFIGVLAFLFTISEKK